ncbi:hypothetical protein N7481_007080 [Penicillium waksmanii]|uniref:uncharacterized protein n=1 Tax=Penicillium waksmanii TaxID=69791 RepID=UPI0025480B3A|nr:uncharacterized protein N7481_007080 [Penicillium waksmanii]KAJ5979782.1 hypothetical protein N7481_007080 [Penicillium waksmanii]
MASCPPLSSSEVGEEPWEPFLAQIRAGYFDTVKELQTASMEQAAKWGYELSTRGHFEEQVKEAWTEFIFDSGGLGVGSQLTPWCLF